jgi:hypothetical protein
MGAANRRRARPLRQMQITLLEHPEGHAANGQTQPQKDEEGTQVKRASWFSTYYDFGWRDILVFSIFAVLFAAFLPAEFQYVAWRNPAIRIVATVLVSALLSGMITLFSVIVIFAR